MLKHTQGSSQFLNKKSFPKEQNLSQLLKIKINNQAFKESEEKKARSALQISLDSKKEEAVKYRTTENFANVNRSEANQMQEKGRQPLISKLKLKDT